MKARFGRKALKEPNHENVDSTLVFTIDSAWSPFAREARIEENARAESLKEGTKKRSKYIIKIIEKV